MADLARVTGMKDEHYNLVSVLYHALQGSETVGQYIGDAEQAGDEKLAEFFRQAQASYKSWPTGPRRSSRASWAEGSSGEPPGWGMAPAPRVEGSASSSCRGRFRSPGMSA